MKKTFFAWALVCLCLFNGFIIITQSNSYATIQIQAIKSFSNLSFGTDPINITNNLQLAKQASSGDGCQGNPYIIENYNISNCVFSTIGISIQNTNKYFVLNNITVSSCATGFIFNNVTFGSIINSYATKNYIGFEIASSSNNKLINDTAAGNFWYGFELSWSSTHNTLSNNTASKNTSYTSGVITPPKNVYIGFRLYQSSYNDLISNKAAGNGEGFELDHSIIII